MKVSLFMVGNSYKTRHPCVNQDGIIFYGSRSWKKQFRLMHNFNQKFEKMHRVVLFEK